MKNISKLFLLLAGFLMFTMSAFSQPEEVKSILPKMVHANQTTPYEGDCITQVDSTRIWQKIYQDASGRRLVQFILPFSLLGKEIIEIPPYIFIRKKKGQKFRKRMNLFHEKIFSHAIADSQMELIFKNYDAVAHPSASFLGRKTILLSFIPKVKNRPSIRILLDRNTFFLLKLEKISPDGKLLQQSYFKNLLFDPVLDPVLFTILPDQIDSTQAGTSKNFTSVDSLQKALSFSLLLPDWIPEGFRLQASRLLRFRKKEFAQLIFSDGLSTLSLFEKKTRRRPSKKRGPAASVHMGVLEMRQNFGRTSVILFGDITKRALEKMMGSFEQPKLDAKSSRNLIIFVGLLIVALIMMVQLMSRKERR